MQLFEPLGAVIDGVVRGTHTVLGLNDASWLEHMLADTHTHLDSTLSLMQGRGVSNREEVISCSHRLHLLLFILLLFFSLCPHLNISFSVLFSLSASLIALLFLCLRSSSRLTEQQQQEQRLLLEQQEG